MHHYIFHFVSFVAFSWSKARSSPGWAVPWTACHLRLCLEGWALGLAGGEWPVLLLATQPPPGHQEGVAFSRRWLEPASCLSWRKAVAPFLKKGSEWCKAPLQEGNITEVSGNIWGGSSSSVTWDCTGVGSSSLYNTLLAGLEEAVPYIMFLQKGTYYHFPYLQYSYSLHQLLLGYELLLSENWVYLFHSVST